MTPQYIKIDSNGNKFYYKDKEMTSYHREDGPAFEGADGYKVWYLNGQPHREDGPAIDHGDGTKNWYKHGKRHREDGPAYEGADGTKAWIINGLYHREDGPAIEWMNGSKEWILNGERLTEQEFLKRTAKETILSMDEIAAKFGIEVSKLKIQK